MSDFPSLIESSLIEMFEAFREQILIVFPLVFLVRLMISFCLFQGKESYFNLLKDTFLMGILLFLFTDFISWTIQFPHFIGETLKDSKTFEVPLSDNRITYYLSKLTDYVAIVCYWVSYSLFILIVTILSLLACHVIFYCTMTGSYLILKMFLSLFLATALWPIFWYGINFATKNLLLTDNAFGNNVVLILGSLLKVLFPLLSSFKFFSNPVMDRLVLGTKKVGSVSKNVLKGSKLVAESTQHVSLLVKQKARSFQHSTLRKLSSQNLLKDLPSKSLDSSLNSMRGQESFYNSPFSQTVALEGSQNKETSSHKATKSLSTKKPLNHKRNSSRSQSLENSPSKRGFEKPFHKTSSQRNMSNNLKHKLSSKNTSQKKLSSTITENERKRGER